jgi:hypothetical protein
MVITYIEMTTQYIQCTRQESMHTHTHTHMLEITNNISFLTKI